MRRGIALLLAGAAGTLPAIGQAQVEQPPQQTFPSPVRAVTLAVSNEIFYDTNVARGNEAAAALRGIENEDVRTTPAASLDIRLPRGRGMFTVRSSIGYDAYARNTRLNRERLSFAAGARLPVAFCDVSPDVAVARRQVDLFDLSIVPGAAMASSQNVQTLQEAGAALACGPSIGIRPGAYVRHATTRNSARLRRAQDVEEIRYGSELNYVHPSVGIITIFAQRRDFTFDQRRLLAISQAPRFSVTNAGLRVDRRLGVRLQLNAAASYADLHTPVSFPGARNFDGLNWDIVTTLRIGGRLLLTAGSDRSITVAPGFYSDAVRQTNHTGAISYAITPLLRLGLSASRAEREFRLAAAPIGIAIAEDRLDVATLRLDYTRREINVSLRGSYQRRDSDNDLFDYRGAQALLSVGYQFKR